MIKVGIINCEISNLTSVYNALKHLSIEAEIINSPQQFKDCSHLILPGVGAYGVGMSKLNSKDLVEPIMLNAKEGKPLLGICLGMQLLATIGEEFGNTNGLNLIAGDVLKLNTFNGTLKIPHVGWNDVSQVGDSMLWNGIPDNSSYYFVHSFAYKNADSHQVIGESEYGENIIVAMQKENVYGVQFHPEKSQKPGLRLLKNFVEEC